MIQVKRDFTVLNKLYYSASCVAGAPEGMVSAAVLWGLCWCVRLRLAKKKSEQTQQRERAPQLYLATTNPTCDMHVRPPRYASPYFAANDTALLPDLGQRPYSKRAREVNFYFVCPEQLRLAYIRT